LLLASIWSFDIFSRRVAIAYTSTCTTMAPKAQPGTGNNPAYASGRGDGAEKPIRVPPSDSAAAWLPWRISVTSLNGVRRV
jgi:hypothetical protein